MGFPPSKQPKLDVQLQYLTFVILDKLGLLFFCFGLLVFCAMWARAINILGGDNALVATLIAVVAAVTAVVICAVVIYFAVVVSVTYISFFYYTYVTDYADIIMACITFVLALLLFIQIAVVTSKLKDDEEKLRNIRIISGFCCLSLIRIFVSLFFSVGVFVMVFALAVRVAMVLVYNYILNISLGYAVYYGLATVFPEVRSKKKKKDPCFLKWFCERWR